MMSPPLYPIRCSFVLLLSALIVSGCSGSSSSSPADTISGANGNVDAPISNPSSGSSDDPTGGLDEPIVAGDSNPEVAPEPETPATVLTRVDFTVTVPVYVSDSLQVQLSWGDKELSAGWVIDETWGVSDEFPSDTENLLNVTFFDRNGAVVLGSYEESFRTGTSPTEIVEIFADQFDTARWDDNDDGVSNLEESIAGTDPLIIFVPPVQNLTRVDFGINVPVITSDALQVQLAWGDETINASWVGDESWSAFADLPADTEEPLTVTFFDRDGDLPLGSYITTYETGNNGAEYFQIESRQINTHRFDEDLDGVSNFREVLGETDPLISDSAVAVTFDIISQRISSGCSGCHGNWRDRDALHETFTNFVSRNEINMLVPFEPEESYLVQKLEGSMLRFGGSGLAELVRAWVTLGALDN